MTLSTAEQIKLGFERSPVTVSIVTLAKAADGARKRVGNAFLYTFPDGSVLRTTGRGRSHKMEVLP